MHIPTLLIKRRVVLHRCMWLQDGMWRVGEGLFCLLTPNHVYIARIKPNSNDLIMLFSIPQPTPGPQAAVPVAAWLPQYRKPTAAGYRMNSSTTSGGGSPSSASSASSDPILMPVAVLALGWGSRLVMFEVPLIGDHVSVAAAVGKQQRYCSHLTRQHVLHSALSHPLFSSILCLHCKVQQATSNSSVSM